jgi:hypothetical protein
MSESTGARLLVKGSGKLARRRRGFVLARGNDKIGGDIFAFNLPAVDTCPGMSAACSSCYARRGRWLFEGVRAALRRNWEASREPFFAERLTREVWDRGVRVVRIHASGDFYDARYVRCWVQVARCCPSVTFYAYTRSWRLPGLRTELERLAALPNVRLWYSADRDTGMPDRLPAGVRVAWLQEDHADPVPPGADVVFRVHRLRRNRARRVGLTLVCPVEQGSGNQTTCSSCGVCWK